MNGPPHSRSRPRRPNPCWAVWSLWATLVLLVAADARAQGIPVVVVTPKGASENMLVGRTPDGIRLQPKGAAGGDFLLKYDQFSEVRFVLPDTIQQADEALQQQQWDLAARLLRPIVQPLLPYLDLPKNNGVRLVLVLADCLRRAARLEDAIGYYDRLRVLAPSDETTQAAIGAAHCHAALGRHAQAWTILDRLGAPRRDSPLFGQYQLVRAQVLFGHKDYLGALDEAARGIAASRMESETFPESLFLAAQCYEMLSQSNVVASVVTNTRLMQFTLGNTNLAHIMRLDTNAPPVAVNTNQVADSLLRLSLPTSFLGSTNYLRAAQTMYAEIATNFPQSIWASRSLPKIQTAAPATTPEPKVPTP